MTSIFDTIASDVCAALTGDARAGTLRRETSGGLDAYGDPLPSAVTTYSFRGWVEAYEAAWLAAGIPSTDSRVVILAESTSAAPKQGDRLSLSGKWWQVRAVEVDPAQATYACQSFEVSAPA